MIKINRQQRRKCERKYGTSFTMQQYRDEAINEGIQKAVDTILYMVAYTLNYKLGLGKKRLPEIIYHIANNIDSYNTGHLTHEDYIEIKRQMNELGVILVDRNKIKRTGM